MGRLMGKNLKPEENVPLSGLTTVRAGGPAKWFVRAANPEELATTLAFAQAEGLPVFLLGGGSNLVAGDGGFPGLVVKLSGEFSRVAIDEEAGAAKAGAGAGLMALGRGLCRKGCGSFLFACGIPGTVGGAVRMNAGTAEGSVSDVLLSADVLLPDGNVKTLNRDQLAFGYRDSLIARENGLIVLGAVFRLGEKSGSEEVMKTVKESLKARRAREPRIKRNFGSVFKNPPGGPPAGKLLEEAGLKGERIGGAMVAPEHANWIVNTGNATGNDLIRLMERMEERVFARFGVRLLREVLVLR